MRSAVIVSTARTAMTRSWSGGLNATHAATMAGHVIAEAVARAGVDPSEIGDVVLGCANPEGASGQNVARQAALRAGLPVSVPGMTVSRFCASGLQSITMAAQRVMTGECDVLIAGGVESISCVQEQMNKHMIEDPWLAAHKPDIYLPMLRTAEIVADRYHIPRDAQDAYGVASQRRASAARDAGRFADEIVQIATVAAVTDQATGETTLREMTVSEDDGIRSDTTIETVSRLRPALPGGTVTAANASGFTDGASACVVMSEGRAERLGVLPLGRFVAAAVAGCEPDEMGIGPALVVPMLLANAKLTVDDIDLWEINEAFACQVLYCRDTLRIPDERLNVDGGAIALGHPYGMSGSRMVGHALLAGRRLGVRRVITTMCVGGGQGVAALFEID